MATRKFLLVTYHFPPSAAVAVHRMLGLVRYLPRFGWEPIVVAPPRVPGEPEDADLLHQIPDGTTVVRVPLADGLYGKVARRAAPLGHWLPRAWRACRRVIREHRPEAIYTSSPPGCVHVLGSLVNSQFGLPWLACLRDPWITAQFTPISWVDRRFGSVFEKQVLRQARFVLANSPNVQRELQLTYPASADKVVLVTNGFDAEQLGPPDPPRRPGPELTMLHAGELYAGRDPRPLLDALVGTEGLRTRFLGRSTEGVYDLAAEVRQRGLDQSVELRDQVPHAEAVREIRAADVLLVLMKPGARVTVPAKLYEYLGIGRPILALVDPEGDAAWVLRQSGILHRSARADDVAGIRQALAELLREVRTGAPAIPDPEALGQFTREHMAKLVAGYLDACVEHAPRDTPRLSEVAS